MNPGKQFQDALDYVFRLGQTPTRLANAAADQRARQQQQQFLDLYNQFREQDQRRANQATAAETAAIRERAPLVAAQQAQRRADEVGHQVTLDNNRANLTNNALTTAGGVQAGLIGAQSDAVVRQAEAAFTGAQGLSRTQYQGERELLGDRLAAAERLTGMSQNFDTGMVDRFVGPVPLAQLNADTAIQMQGAQHGLIRELARMQQPTDIGRAIGYISDLSRAVAGGLIAFRRG